MTDEFFDRVKRAYRLAHKATTISPDSMWAYIADKQKSIHDALLADHSAPLRAIFENPSGSFLFYGVDPAFAGGQRIPDSEAEAVIRLAEAIGVRRWLPPGVEQALNYQHIGQEESPDINQLLDTIANSIGFQVQFPSPFVNEQAFGGLKTTRGLVTIRAIHALYSCHRVMQELQGNRSARVLEIGPGLGRTIHFLHQAGFRNLTTIDLPMGLVAQACFLGGVLGPDAIWLSGDPPHLSHGRIQLLSRRTDAQRPFDLALNVDSLTEMGAESEEWANWVTKNARIFLSINHEANKPTVANIGKRHFASARVQRSPWWLRSGYVEEIFRFDPIRQILARVGTVVDNLRSWSISRARWPR
jgi:hypothetical protein